MLTGQLTVNVTDPGNDGRTTLQELTSSGLTNVFQAGIDANFDIDGLVITASPPLPDALPPIGISLDGDTDGHVLSLGDLTGLPSKIQVTGLENYTGLEHLSFEQIILMLGAFKDWLIDVADVEFLATDLPLVGFSVSDLRSTLPATLPCSSTTWPPIPRARSSLSSGRSSWPSDCSPTVRSWICVTTVRFWRST